VLVKLVEDDVWRRVALQLDDDADALAIRLVLEIRDPGDRLLGVGLVT
jgi:hypothetical protein